MRVTVIETTVGGTALRALVNVLSSVARDAEQTKKKSVLLVYCCFSYITNLLIVQMVGKSETISSLRRMTWREALTTVDVGVLQKICMPVTNRENVDVLILQEEDAQTLESVDFEPISYDDVGKLRKLVKMLEESYQHIVFFSSELNDSVVLSSAVSERLIWHGYHGFILDLKKQEPSNQLFNGSRKNLALASDPPGDVLKGSKPQGWELFYEPFEWDSDVIDSFLNS